MDRLLSLCLCEATEYLKDIDETRCAGGATENLAAHRLIARLCPPSRHGIWFMSDQPVSAADLISNGALAVPNRSTNDADGPDFVPNRTNEWGDPIFSAKAAASVGLSHLIPVYVTKSRCAISVSAP